MRSWRSGRGPPGQWPFCICLAGCREGKAGGSAVVLPFLLPLPLLAAAFVCPAGALSLGSRCGSRCESGRPPVTAPHVTPGAINSWAAGAQHPPGAGAAAEGARGSRPGRPAHGGGRTPVGAGEPGCGRRGPGLEDTPEPYPLLGWALYGMVAPWRAGWEAPLRSGSCAPSPHPTTGSWGPQPIHEQPYLL